MFKSLFDNVFLFVGAVVLAAIAFFGLTYAVAVHPVITSGVIAIVFFGFVIKRLARNVDDSLNKTGELPRWIRAESPTLQKLQKRLWTK